ncbi:phage tail protein [Pseudarthrobacter siccitolerans]
MAVELGAAMISVGLSTGGLAADIKKAFSGAGDVGGEAGKSAGKGFGLGFAGIATAALGALSVGSFFKGAISSAGDLQQSAGAISSVFKQNAGDMLKWSQTADSALGLTQNEYNELGTIIGAQLKNGGTAMDELAPKTNALITTGADLASMFGGTTSEAVEALSSALKGERDPIERYGVSLNQAKIDAEAAALGFSKVGGSFDQTAQQAATLSLITKQTADATGNFARESETLSGQQQRMAAGFKDIQTNIGGLFLPALTSAFGFINSNVLPSLDKFTGALGDEGLGSVFAPLKGMLANVQPFFNAFAATWAPMIPTVIGLAAAFSPLNLIFSAVKPVLGDLAGLFQVVGLTVGTVLTTALTAITPVVQSLVTHLSGLAVAVMPALSAVVSALGEALVGLAPVIGSVITQLAPLISSLVSQLSPVITTLVAAILPPLVSIIGDVALSIGPLVGVLMEALIPAIQELMPVVVTVFSFIADLIKNVMQAIQGTIQVVTGIITGDWGKVWTGIQNIFGAVWANIQTIIAGAVAIVGSVLTMGMNNASRIVGGVLENIVGLFASLGGKIMGALSGAGSWLVDVGRNIIQGLINGVSGMINNAVQAVKNVGGAMLDGIKGFLGIHSPSRVFKTEVGMMIGAGVMEGINASKPGVTASMDSLVSVPTVPAFSAGAYSASLSPASYGQAPVNVYIGNEQLDTRMYRVAGSAIGAADNNSQYMRKGR